MSEKALNDTLLETLLLLADISYYCGLIGLSEYLERLEVAEWLMDEKGTPYDPRTPDGSYGEENGQEGEPLPSDDKVQSERSKGERETTGGDEDPFIHLIPDGLRHKWLFTGSDPDYYPSVPHGHLEDANRSWPKLNPYTGRAFSAKHQENSKMRLRKGEMRTLWRNEKFRKFCRNAVLWYLSEFPVKKFPGRITVAHPLRFPRR